MSFGMEDQAFSRAFVGYAWGADIAVEGAEPGDRFVVSIHRARDNGSSAVWAGSVDENGDLLVRFDGNETRNWRIGLAPVSIAMERGERSGVIGTLPPLLVVYSSIRPIGSELLLIEA